MPHFTAIALDRLIDSGASKSADKSGHGSMTVPRHPLSPKSGSSPKLGRRNSTNSTQRNSMASTQRRVPRPQMTPALYATPETTPLPDSPSSFPPSPYIINHKRRGPRLGKNPPEADASSCEKSTGKAETSLGARETSSLVVAHAEAVPVSPLSSPVKDSHAIGAYERHSGSTSNGEAVKSNLGQNEKFNGGSIGENNYAMPVTLTPSKEGDSEDFYDPQDTMSYTSSTDVDDSGTPDRASKMASAGGEFYDAWEELSSDSGPQSSLRALEEELREIRLSLLMEIEKRKQAEEALRNMRNLWQRMREQLSLVGLTLRADPTVETEQLDADPVEELSQQVHLARFVSEAIGRGIAKSEAETVMEAQLEAKNFEIARLWDRLHYYEAVNHEMSQRNQEAVETARRRRQIRKRKQRWVWGSIAATITIGAAALSWSYLQSGKGSSSHHAQVQAPERSDEANR
ncbi:uncharacterized protein LOC116211627 [Punica granatum]|uniref:Uncharacterized protein n=2 Tax=Punica granatum TaxID=22663 RepID=A0A218WP77_PUNGR|nr:uncharacterized protein LOC116211627 [Punica granatum]OWM74634.1 hypothetical protein CDL15_Pgr005214 [Punica granatum]PKI70788.1 hypothetical protein CRG98_008818 [Punica granatum]